MFDRQQVMDDRPFWDKLEHAACRTLSATDHLRGYWIDGFLPDSLKNTKTGAKIEGIVWVVDGPGKQDQYRFALELSQKLLSGSREFFSITSIHLDEKARLLELKIGKL